MKHPRVVECPSELHRGAPPGAEVQCPICFPFWRTVPVCPDCTDTDEKLTKGIIRDPSEADALRLIRKLEQTQEGLVCPACGAEFVERIGS